MASNLKLDLCSYDVVPATSQCATDGQSSCMHSIYPCDGEMAVRTQNLASATGRTSISMSSWPREIVRIPEQYPNYDTWACLQASPPCSLV